MSIAAIVVVSAFILVSVMIGLLIKFHSVWFRPSTKIPGWDTRIDKNVNGWDLQEIAEVLDIVHERWPCTPTLRKQLRDAFDKTNIHCMPGYSFMDNVGREVAGIMRDGSNVIVATGKPWKPYKSALAQEMIHIGLGALYGDPWITEKGVEYPEGSWQMVLRKQLKAIELEVLALEPEA